MTARLLVFTDLDGTLMEHESYSVEPAVAALAELAERAIPLILVTSKTSAEIVAIKEALGLDGPYICENGAALYLEEDAAAARRCVEFGKRLEQWLPAVHDLRARHGWRFHGFSDWNDQQVSDLTGLAIEQAALARQRHYSEPLLWRDSQRALADFQAAIQEMDLQLLEGGRFLSLQGLYDKSGAVQFFVSRQASHREHGAITTVALGDSPNDTAMLEQADIAVIIKSAKSDRIQLQQPGRVIRTLLPGPAGWQEAMDEILKTLD